MHRSTPEGITPPAPGLAREEPDLWVEDDIPTDDPAPVPSERDERPGRERERE